ncbi:Ribonuclease H-like superfamily [Sesbania bispinosa]|nr:Ribonuclease H-like superfamily [Sesbania bispinosa]
MARDLNVKHLKIKGDSNLIIKQLKGEYGVKEASLAAYREEALKLTEAFEGIEATHIPRAENRHADALATIGSKETRSEEEEVVVFRRLRQPSIMILQGKKMKADWRRPVIENLKQKTPSKAVKEYHQIHGQLYKRSHEGLLMKCVAESAGMQKADNLHHATCNVEGPSLYRRMQRVGMFWPTMKAYCDQVQANCASCREAKEWVGINVIEGDWRQPIRQYLEKGTLPLEHREADKLKRKA